MARRNWDIFVEVWHRLPSVDAVARELNLRPNTVRIYASRLRKQGVRMEPHRTGVDADRLNRIAAATIAEREGSEDPADSASASRIKELEDALELALAWPPGSGP